MSTPQILQTDEMCSLLRACCERGTPATIRSMVNQTVHSANFQEFCGSTLRLQLQARAGYTPPQSGLCCVIFCRDRKTYLFTTVVTQSTLNSQVELELPEELTMERRSSIRVPSDGGLQVTVTTPEGQKLKTKPRNLSLSGIFLDAEGAGCEHIAPDTRLELVLQLGQLEARIAAAVRRRVGNSYGILFSSAPSEQPFEPPDALHHIYTLLRQRQLPRRLLKAAPRPAAGQTVSIPVGRAT